jgi:putative endonuclease
LKNDKKEFGVYGENLAAGYLADKGYQIIERNFRWGAKGEIDIVARDGETLVFVEVKTRQNYKFGDPLEGITPGKVRQIRRIAEGYLFKKQIHEAECRFDVIGVMAEKGREPELKHIKDAF